MFTHKKGHNLVLQPLEGADFDWTFCFKSSLPISQKGVFEHGFVISLYTCLMHLSRCYDENHQKLSLTRQKGRDYPDCFPSFLSGFDAQLS